MGTVGEATAGSGSATGGGSEPGPSTGGDSDASGGLETDGGPATSGGQGTSSGFGTTGEGGDTSGVRFDVGGPGDGPPPACDPNEEDCGCNAVDILFVIDNSGSMRQTQVDLAAAFPGFADAMANALPPNTDLHVGITTTAFAGGGAHSEYDCRIQPAFGDPDTPADAYVVPTDREIQDEGHQGRLFTHDGKTFFAADSGNPAQMADLKTWFGQAAQVGINAAWEFPAASAAWAFHGHNAGYNAGFIRDEGAVLVLFLITDEIDQSFDVEDPGRLHDMVSAAKAGCGGDRCIVTGGLLAPDCVAINENAAHEFMSSFGKDPVWGDIYRPAEYVSVVGEALSQVVAQTCELVPPVG